MKKVEKGSFVKICYTAKLEDGAIFEQTGNCQSTEVEVGAGEVIQGLEDALLGMIPHEKKAFTVAPDDAYGERDERLQQTILRSSFGPDVQPRVGEIIGFRTPKGEQLPAMVKQVDGEHVTIDFNHPLAGKSLFYEVEIAEINDRKSASSDVCSSGCCCPPTH